MQHSREGSSTWLCSLLEGLWLEVSREEGSEWAEVSECLITSFEFGQVEGFREKEALCLI